MCRASCCFVVLYIKALYLAQLTGSCWDANAFIDMDNHVPVYNQGYREVMCTNLHTGWSHYQHQSNIGISFFPRNTQNKHLFCWCLRKRCWVCLYTGVNIDGLVHERCNSSVFAMELHLSCTNPCICHTELDYLHKKIYHRDFLSFLVLWHRYKSSW